MENRFSGADHRLTAVQFPEADTFNAAYSVYAADPESARRTLTGGVRSLLEASDRLAVECNGSRFLSCRDIGYGMALPVQQIAGFVADSLRLFLQLSEASFSQS